MNTNVALFDAMRTTAHERIAALGWEPSQVTGQKFRPAALRLRDHLSEKFPGLYKPWVESVAYTALKDRGFHF